MFLSSQKNSLQVTQVCVYTVFKIVYSFLLYTVEPPWPGSLKDGEIWPKIKPNFKHGFLV